MLKRKSKLTRSDTNRVTITQIDRYVILENIFMFLQVLLSGWLKLDWPNDATFVIFYILQFQVLAGAFKCMRTDGEQICLWYILHMQYKDISINVVFLNYCTWPRRITRTWFLHSIASTMTRGHVLTTILSVWARNAPWFVINVWRDNWSKIYVFV